MAGYTVDKAVASNYWNNLLQAYTDSERYYHNLDHIEHLFTVLGPVQQEIDDWDSLAFAVFYHDAVYNVVEYVTTNDNEDKSAALAEEVLTTIGYPHQKIERVKRHILATKKHEQCADADTNYLSDADLSILGSTWAEYEAYMNGIRKEYAVYPDSIYVYGRQKVLKDFLLAEPLFKTPHFQATYGAAAKENIARELEITSFY